MPWIEANGVSLRYEQSGQGEGLVVLVHEAGGSLESWDAIMPGLQARFRVLRYDQRGFGQSERAPILSLAGMVADLRALLNVLQLDREPAQLVGTAIGGTIVLAFAAAYPERVRNVVATSPVTGSIPAAGRESLEKRAQTVVREGMRAVVDSALFRSYPVALRRNTDSFRRYRALFLANDPESFAALSRSYGEVDLQPVYPNVACPALVIGCTQDPIKPAVECAAAAAAMPDGRYLELCSGHFLAVQSPQLLTDTLVEFFGANS